LLLNEYIGNGEPWDLDRNYGGVHMLPPYQAKSGAEWYMGTANAVYQNIHFIEKYNPSHVLVLGGDHIYRMDYNAMLETHINNDADITISVLEVTPEEATRFGIMSYDKDGRVTDFEEKPKKPKSLTASMGIYIFKTQVLLDELRRDEADEKSSKDFGKNIIPHMLSTGRRLFAHQFKGYWKDVGTVSSLWEANMDLIGDKPVFEMGGDNFKVYSRNPALPPMYAAESAVIKNTLTTGGCEIFGTVENSVLGEGVYIGKGAVVRNSVIFNGSRIGDNAVIDYAVIDENVTIGKNVVIGDEKSGPENIALVGRNYVVKDGSKLKSDCSLDITAK
jgi:glucose-1-phosphate adenylyltransferase